jgi:hypothetical protein
MSSRATRKRARLKGIWAEKQVRGGYVGAQGFTAAGTLGAGLRLPGRLECNKLI